MKNVLSKIEAQQFITSFFQREAWRPDELKKIKHLAMRHRLKLTLFKKLFCKNCLHSLKGKTRISKTYKTVVCDFCQYRTKWNLTLS